MRNLSKNVEILQIVKQMVDTTEIIEDGIFVKIFWKTNVDKNESHSHSENGLKRPFGVKNDKYGPCHGADFYENDTLSRSRNPENDTLFSGTSPYGKIHEYPPGFSSLVSLRSSIC